MASADRDALESLLPWLLDPAVPAVRHLAMRRLLDLPADDHEVVAARRAAMGSDPIAAILRAQQPDGWWEKPGPGYATKYRGTVWQLIFLDQMGADPDDERVRRACRYVLDHSRASSGGFGASGQAGAGAPPPSAVIHCLNGNVLRALLGFGWAEDERVQGAIGWLSSAATGQGHDRWYASGTSGPSFACAANDGLPCAWGATKAMLALARVPPRDRASSVRAAIEVGVDLLLSVDPSSGAYPAGYGNTRPNGSWFRLGFPSGYVTDVLQVLEALCELGLGHDRRLDAAIDWLLAKRDATGRWRNEYPYSGKLWADVEAQGGEPSRWVTLRAMTVLRAAGRVGESLQPH